MDKGEVMGVVNDYLNHMLNDIIEKDNPLERLKSFAPSQGTPLSQ